MKTIQQLEVLQTIIFEWIGDIENDISDLETKRDVFSQKIDESHLIKLRGSLAFFIGVSEELNLESSFICNAIEKEALDFDCMDDEAYYHAKTWSEHDPIESKYTQYE